MKKVCAILMFAYLWTGNPLSGQTPTTGASMPGKAHAVVGEFLIGGWMEGKWLSPEDIASFVPAGEKFKIWSYDENLGEGIGSGVDQIEGPGLYYNIEIEKGPYKEPKPIDGQAKTDTLAIAGDWNALPRKPKIQTGGLKPYEEAILDLLRQNDIHVPHPKPTSVIRVDLDGDKEDEVIVVSSNANSGIPQFQKNTYCLVFMRKLVQGKVETTILSQEYYHEDKGGEANSPIGYLQPLVMDLNGDGKMEIILHGNYYEGSWYEIWEMQGNTPVKVLTTSVGA